MKGWEIRQFVSDFVGARTHDLVLLKIEERYMGSGSFSKSLAYPHSEIFNRNVQSYSNTSFQILLITEESTFSPDDIPF